MAGMHEDYRAENVGIRGIYLYFPRLMVQQSDLEAVDNCLGKYTVGLGQEAMAFCGDREDVVSMAATAVLKLLEATGVSAAAIGRIDVGTETGVDRSKSVMSYLLEHFQQHGNTSIQGSDHMHGCYGGTAALFGVVDWVSSPSWDGRLGIAVATDIAVYPESSPARPTGGGGAAALLIGPNAPLVLEPWPCRSHFSSHTFDFFKPHGHPLYPVVDGPATTFWFSKAADACTAQLHRQLQQWPDQHRHHAHLANSRQQQAPHPQQQLDDHPQQSDELQQQQPPPGLLHHFDYFLSHAPYNKIVRKVFARIVLQDMLRQDQHTREFQQQQQQLLHQPYNSKHSGPAGGEQEAANLSYSTGSSCRCQGEGGQQQQQQRCRAPLPPLPPEASGLNPDSLPDSSISDKQLEKVLLAASAAVYQDMASEGVRLQRQLGNLYTASLYSGLAALLAQQGSALAGKRVLCFSFGSGVVSSMFVLRGRGLQEGPLQHHLQQQQHCSLQDMADQLHLAERLAGRLARSPADFDAAMASLRAAYGAAPYQPGYGPLEELERGVVYLDHIDDKFRRFYSRT